jgi:hypothetical protein
MEAVSDWVVDVLGGSRYLEGAYSLRHDKILLWMYTAEYLFLGLSVLVIAACLFAKRSRLTGLNQPAAALYGLTFLAAGLFWLTNLATLFAPIYRLDVVLGGVAATVATYNAGLTVKSLFGHTDEPPTGTKHA